METYTNLNLLVGGSSPSGPTYLKIQYLLRRSHGRAGLVDTIDLNVAYPGNNMRQSCIAIHIGEPVNRIGRVREHPSRASYFIHPMYIHNN